MNRDRAAPWLFGLAVVAVALAVVALDAWRAPRSSWDLRGLHLVPVVSVGEPVVAFVDADCDGCARPLLQVRVCAGTAAASCAVSARVAPDPTGPTRVRYPRPLATGRHRVEVLLLDVDRWGVVRTSAVAEGAVDVR